MRLASAVDHAGLMLGHLGGVAHFRIPAQKPNVDFLLLLLLRILRFSVASSLPR